MDPIERLMRDCLESCENVVHAGDRRFPLFPNVGIYDETPDD